VINGGRWKADQMLFINDAQHLVVPGGLEQDEIRVFDMKTLQEVDRFKVGKPTVGRSFLQVKATPDSAFLVTFGTDKTIRVWSTPFGPKTDAPVPKEKDKAP
jgi:hypothetical protein